MLTTIGGDRSEPGSPGDYDRWAAHGNPGWSFAEVLPFFGRLERDLDFDGRWHGRDGPLPIRRTTPDEVGPVHQASWTAVPPAATGESATTTRQGRSGSAWSRSTPSAGSVRAPRSPTWPGPAAGPTSPSAAARWSTGWSWRTGAWSGSAWPSRAERCEPTGWSWPRAATGARRCCSGLVSDRPPTWPPWASPWSPTGPGRGAACGCGRPTRPPPRSSRSACSPMPMTSLGCSPGSASPGSWPTPARSPTCSARNASPARRSPRRARAGGGGARKCRRLLPSVGTCRMDQPTTPWRWSTPVAASTASTGSGWWTPRSCPQPRPPAPTSRPSCWPNGAPPGSPDLVALATDRGARSGRLAPRLLRPARSPCR
jgi:hypothetical protein